MEQTSTSSEQLQKFLDENQYTVKGILRYEKVFGEGFISTGGLETTEVSICFTLFHSIKCCCPSWHSCLVNDLESMYPLALAKSEITVFKSLKCHFQHFESNSVLFATCDRVVKIAGPFSIISVGPLFYLVPVIRLQVKS